MHRRGAEETQSLRRENLKLRPTQFFVDINGFWRDEHGLPSWLEVNFNGLQTIQEIDGFTIPDCPACLTQADPSPTQTFSQFGATAFEVQYWTGSSWATVPGGAITGNNLVWRKLTFAPLMTSKIRVVVNAAPDSVARIAEVEAWTGGSSGTSSTVQWLIPDHLGTPRNDQGFGVNRLFKSASGTFALSFNASQVMRSFSAQVASQISSVKLDHDI